MSITRKVVIGTFLLIHRITIREEQQLRRHPTPPVIIIIQSPSQYELTCEDDVESVQPTGEEEVEDDHVSVVSN